MTQLGDGSISASASQLKKRAALEQERWCFISQKQRLIEERDLILQYINEHLDELDAEITVLGGVSRQCLSQEETAKATASKNTVPITVGGYPPVKKKRGRPKVAKNPAKNAEKLEQSTPPLPPQVMAPQEPTTTQKRSRPSLSANDSGEENESNSQPTKQRRNRGKGRPKKKSQSMSAPAQDPFAIVPLEDHPMAKRGRGRPRKQPRPPSADLPPKATVESRHMPAVQNDENGSAADTNDHQPMKRSRGRPRKQTVPKSVPPEPNVEDRSFSAPRKDESGRSADTKLHPPAKRGRGRPRKHSEPPSLQTQHRVENSHIPAPENDESVRPAGTKHDPPKKRGRGRPRKHPLLAPPVEPTLPILSQAAKKPRPNPYEVDPAHQIRQTVSNTLSDMVSSVATFVGSMSGQGNAGFRAHPMLFSSSAGVMAQGNQVCSFAPPLLSSQSASGAEMGNKANMRQKM